MAYAEGRDGVEPPAELTLYFMTQNYHALPDAGGLYEQDARMMNHMSTLGNIYHTVKRIRGARGEDIHRLSDSDLDMWDRLSKMGVMD